jgi:hypothetical protein
MVHGTGTGKTCTAIQIAEEYILRPEFQDKRVFVLANPSVQENFKTQIFDISRVTLDPNGLLLSKQCTGRRYLDMLQRMYAEPLKWTSAESRERLMRTASRIIDEFYEIQGYNRFANVLEEQQLKLKTADMDAWIHQTFDNRLIIVDEAHNLRETSETSVDEKIVSAALKRIVQTASGVTLVLLTATPMYDRFEEILDYMNMFMWNERKQAPGESVKRADIFTPDGDFVSADAETTFRKLCASYVSFVRGENPFTFPFRLPPPDDMIAPRDRETDARGKAIKTPLRYLTLTQSIVSPTQEEIMRTSVEEHADAPFIDHTSICTYPDGREFKDVFEKTGAQYRYRDGVEPFLAPDNVATYSAKFATIMRCIEESKGIVLVYSNIVMEGAQLFAMCLEEHGFRSAMGEPLLETRANKRAGQYVLFTSDSSNADIKKALARMRRRENADGSEIRVIVASPKVSEGVDFRYVRQIHVLDPWFNMSRIEQVLGRGMRTCSHSILPFEEQNCTVYLHVCRYPDSKDEAMDEYIYRNSVEQKAIRIAKVKKVVMESAMDCELEYPINSLPQQWLDLQVSQVRAQNATTVSKPLSELMASSFLPEEDAAFTCKVAASQPDPDHVRPLSAILDVRDEILDRLLVLFEEKPIWKKDDLVQALTPYDAKLVTYIVQNAISTGFKLKDTHGRIGHLETKKGVFAFAVRDRETMQDRYTPPPAETPVPLAVVAVEKPPAVAPAAIDISTYEWPEFARGFSDEVKTWYYVDRVLTPESRFAHMLNLDWDALPDYAKSLKVPGADLIVLGSGQIYTRGREAITPIGAEEDAYRAWLTALKDRYISTRDAYFATMKGDAILFNVDEKSIPLKKAQRSKNIGGRACTSYDEKILGEFVKWFGDAFPGSVKQKKQRCMYIDLLIRKAILEKKQGIVWWTPEEWSVLNEDANRKELLKRLK